MKQVAKWLTFYLGALATLFGLLFALLPSAGSVSQGATGMHVTAAVLVLASSPALALPFSARVARLLLFRVLTLFAIGALVAAFGTVISTQPNYKFKVAAIVFAILVAIRVGISRRRQNTG